jgi:hypothetical protein
MAVSTPEKEREVTALPCLHQNFSHEVSACAQKDWMCESAGGEMGSTATEMRLGKAAEKRGGLWYVSCVFYELCLHFQENRDKSSTHLRRCCEHK